MSFKVVHLLPTVGKYKTILFYLCRDEIISQCVKCSVRTAFQHGVVLQLTVGRRQVICLFVVLLREVCFLKALCVCTQVGSAFLLLVPDTYVQSRQWTYH